MSKKPSPRDAQQIWSWGTSMTLSEWIIIGIAGVIGLPILLVGYGTVLDWFVQ